VTSQQGLYVCIQTNQICTHCRQIESEISLRIPGKPDKIICSFITPHSLADRHTLVLSPMLRRFIGHQPWMWVGIALAVVAIAAPALGASSRDITPVVGMLLIIGLLVTYLTFTMRTFGGVIVALRNAFGTYQRAVGPDGENSPMRLSRLSSEIVRETEETRKAVWDVFADKTSDISAILTQLLDDHINALDELDPTDRRAETSNSLIVFGEWLTGITRM
jgi:hypothetical protein